jgi:hypothetical protein
VIRGDDTGAVAAEAPIALASLLAWGLVLRVDTTVIVHADDASFRAATGQREPDLRAWTTFRTVELAPLSSWSDASPTGVRERLTHELCHAALYQRFRDDDGARAARIPRFFEEGACSVVADQGARRIRLEDTVALAPPMPLTVDVFEGDPQLAYSASHHLMALVAEKHGDHVFARILDEAVKDGAPGCVERALEKVTGADVRALWQMVIDSAGMAI